MQASSDRSKANDTICVSDDKSKMEISFQRTIRVSDGVDTSELPPSMGTSICPRAQTSYLGSLYPRYTFRALTHG